MKTTMKRLRSLIREELMLEYKTTDSISYESLPPGLKQAVMDAQRGYRGQSMDDMPFGGEDVRYEIYVGFPKRNTYYAITRQGVFVSRDERSWQPMSREEYERETYTSKYNPLHHGGFR